VIAAVGRTPPHVVWSTLGAMKTSLLSVFAVACLAAGCQQVAPPASVTDAQGNTVTEWAVPAGAGSAEPDLFVTADGRLLLSWVKPFDQTRKALQFSTYSRDGRWQWAPKTIAVGATMMVNWADTPHIAATADGALWAHWLQRTRGADDQPGAESHDIILARSTDEGMTWSAPIRAHDDGRAVEHGFVSFWPAERDRLGIAWLDGRNLGTPASGGKPAGMMALRAATVAAVTAQVLTDSDDAGASSSTAAASETVVPQVQGAVEVDATVCDCCGTDAAMTARGPLLVYRDRTADEIRDVYATRFDAGAWRTPQAVHADRFKTAACPMNGPAVAAAGEQAVVAWFTAADGAPRLQAAASRDAGDTFAAPVVVDKGDAMQGRADIALDSKQAWIAWLREDAQGASLWLARYTPDLSRELARVRIATLQTRGHGAGVPKLAARDGEAFVVWTDVADGVSQLHGARVRGR